MVLMQVLATSIVLMKPLIPMPIVTLFICNLSQYTTLPPGKRVSRLLKEMASYKE